VGRAIGIDLGTTYCAVAAVTAVGKAEVLMNREGERITPSVVMFQDGITQVGTLAKRIAPTAPDDVVQFVKRQMGEASWKFQTSHGPSFSAEQVSAIILKRLAEDAELMLGEPIDAAVITVPAYFDDARRQATRDAGNIAGLNVVGIINEPTAAALSFGLDTGFEGRALVFDLGGGTFDVTVMSIHGGEFAVEATEGDRNLGGFNWDNELMSLLNKKAMEAGAPDLFDDDLATAELRDKAETAKRTLSNVAESRIVITAGGQHHTLTVTRDEFERATAHLLRRTETITEMAMEQAGRTWADIDKILLVGGSTRMPMVWDLVETLSGQAPDRTINADEAVALGAAVHAQLLLNNSAPGASALPVIGHHGHTPRVLDVCSQGLGVIILDEDIGAEINSVIISHNTRIPAQQERTYFTVSDNQDSIRLRITEGDDTDVDYVKIIHQHPLEIPRYPAGAPLRVVMSFDVDGIVHVEVFDETQTPTASLGEVELDRPSNLSRDEVDAKVTELNLMDIN